jgi:hypothetical protein
LSGLFETVRKYGEREQIAQSGLAQVQLPRDRIDTPLLAESQVLQQVSAFEDKGFRRLLHRMDGRGHAVKRQAVHRRYSEPFASPSSGGASSDGADHSVGDMASGINGQLQLGWVLAGKATPPNPPG